MKVRVVCQYYHPEPFKIAQICEPLVARGHPVHVVTGPPNDPTGEMPEEYRHHQRRRQAGSGLTVNRMWEIPRRRDGLGLLLNYADFATSVSLKALTLRP